VEKPEKTWQIGDLLYGLRITQPRLPAVLMSADDSQPEQLRSVRSVLLHLFILQMTVSVAAGHLGSLQKLNITPQRYFVLCSILFPATAFLETIVIIFVTLRNYKEWDSLSSS